MLSKEQSKEVQSGLFVFSQGSINTFTKVHSVNTLMTCSHRPVGRATFLASFTLDFPSNLRFLLKVVRNLLLSFLFLLPALEKCNCLTARDCPRGSEQKLCVMLTRFQRTRSMDLCSVAALRCSNYQLEILQEGECPPS